MVWLIVALGLRRGPSYIGTLQLVLGCNLAGAGEFNGDDLDDLLLGAWRRETGIADGDLHAIPGSVERGGTRELLAMVKAETALEMPFDRRAPVRALLLSLAKPPCAAQTPAGLSPFVPPHLHLCSGRAPESRTYLFLSSLSIRPSFRWITRAALAATPGS